MARLFTITFPFAGKEHNAEITVDDATDPYSISVYVLDKSLHDILPDGKAVFEVTDKVLPLSKDAPPAEILKYQILVAFNAHENQMPPINVW